MTVLFLLALAFVPVPRLPEVLRVPAHCLRVPTDPVASKGSSSRAANRAHQNAERDLSQALVLLTVPGNAATRYSEALAALGVRSASELTRLSKAQLDACEMRSEHRQLLWAQAALEAAEATAPQGAVDPFSYATRPAAAAATRDPDDENPADDGQEQVEELLVSEELDGARLDAALASLLPPLSRSYFAALCSEGRVRIDGTPATKKSLKVARGATIRVTLRAAAELAVSPEALPLEVLYEDECMLAVNKASGMVTHPAPGHWSGTFANALAHRVLEQQHASGSVAAHDDGAVLGTPERPATWPDGAVLGTPERPATSSLPDLFGDGLRPGIVHRLDRYTTGVLLGAKTAEAQRSLLDAFAGRRVSKLYLAIVAGVPEETVTITARIGRHPTDRVKMAVVAEDARGRHAHSVVHRLASDGRLSLVAVKIGTGRTHQIRVHVASLRCPVLGDPLYGDGTWNKKEAKRAARPLLHALQISLAHPLRGDALQVRGISPQSAHNIPTVSPQSPTISPQSPHNLPTSPCTSMHPPNSPSTSMTFAAALQVRAPPPDDLRAIGAELAGCDADAESFDAWLAPRLEAALSEEE